MNKQSKQYYLGIDAGGTHCRVSLFDRNGERVGCGVAGAGHPVHGMKTVLDNVLAATDQARLEAGLAPGVYHDIIAGGGYAGAHLPHFTKQLESWPFPFFAHFITTDLHVACLGAHGFEDGGVVILGTGSSAMAIVNGKTYQVGGQGFLLGDMACGSWLGLQAVKHAIAYRDGMQPDSSLVDAVETLYKASGNALADKLINAVPAEFARSAKLVFEHAQANDNVAKRFLDQAINDANQLVERLVEIGCTKVSLLGSVGKRLQPYLNETTQQYLNEPKDNAEYGAMLFAKASFDESDIKHVV